MSVLVVTGFLAAGAARAADDAIIAPEPGGPAYNQWYVDDFVGPEDGQLWHSAFYLLGIRQEQLLKRHWGLLIRCTEAPVTNPLVVTFAFGAVLRTRERGEIAVNLKFDQQRTQRLPLISRNHANAEMTGVQALDFIQRSLGANQFRVNARLSPKGRGDIRIPLHEGRQVIAQLMANCAIPVAPPPALAAAAESTSAPSQREQPKSDPFSRAIAGYWQTDSLAARRRAAVDVLMLRPTFDALQNALQTTQFYIDPVAAADTPGQGHSYLGQRAQDGAIYPYHVRVPRTYNTNFSSPLYVYLHGGVNRPAWRNNQQWWQHNLFPADAFVVSPAGWRNAFWWHSNQLENLLELIIRLKQRYNIDDNRIHVVGVSDGGAGTFFLNASAATSFASFASLIGHPGVLESRRANTTMPPPLTNLVNRPMFLLNGDSDPLYPVKSLLPYTERFERYGVNFETHWQKNSGHTISELGDVRDQLAEFFKKHPRPQQPSELYWEALPFQPNSRIDWVNINTLSPKALRSCVSASYSPQLFDVRTEGIDEISLLIPAGYPKQQSIRVRVNGITKEFAPEPPAPATLLKWHARDFDRSRLYQRELQISVADFAKAKQPVCL